MPIYSVHCEIFCEENITSELLRQYIKDMLESGHNHYSPDDPRSTHKTVVHRALRVVRKD